MAVTHEFFITSVSGCIALYWPNGITLHYISLWPSIESVTTIAHIACKTQCIDGRPSMA